VTTTTNNSAPTLAEAEAALVALHDRLLTGDPAVTAHDYAEARAAVEFASARQEVARRAEAQRAAEERQQRVDDATARLAALDTAAHDAARDQLRAALDNLAVAVLSRSAELGEIVGAAGVSYGPGGRVTLGGVTRDQLPYQRIIRDVAEDAVRAHFGPRQWFDLNSPPD